MSKKYQQLIDLYAEENLTRISSKLITLYKTGQKNTLTQIARIAADFTKIQDGNMSKIFTQLIMLYHPDRATRIQHQIQSYLAKNKIAALKQYAHILEINDMDAIIDQYAEDDIMELEEDYRWENDADDYDIFEEEEPAEFELHKPDYFDFYTAVKRKVYGNQPIDFPPHYLEDFEEIEMSGESITDLSGAEYCKFVKKLYLNNNEITDVSELVDLEYLEELYLSRNQIGFIDALESLENLAFLDLSFNDIDDISPILSLKKLRYVNLLGNNIPKEQVQILKEKDIVVIS